MKLMEPFVKLYFAISAHVQGIGKETSLIKFRDVNVIHNLKFITKLTIQVRVMVRKLIPLNTL